MQRFPWRYVLAWIPMVPIAILNGVLRVQTYGRLMPEIHAHQLSTLTGVVLIGSYIALVLRRWPTASVAEAWRVGLMWVVMTVGFEFGFGHYVMGQPWPRLLHDYDLGAGRVWLLFLVAVAGAPAWFHRRRA